MNILTAVIGLFNTPSLFTVAEREMTVELQPTMLTLDVLPYDVDDMVAFQTPNGKQFRGWCIEVVEVESDDNALWSFVLYEYAPKKMATVFMPYLSFWAVQQ